MWRGRVYFSLSFYPIDFKPWHNELGFGEVYFSKSFSKTFLSHTSCSSGFIQDFLNHYVDQCRFNYVHVGRSPMNESSSVIRGLL